MCGVSNINTKKVYFKSIKSSHTFNYEGSAKRFLTGEFREIETHNGNNFQKIFCTRLNKNGC